MKSKIIEYFYIKVSHKTTHSAIYSAYQQLPRNMINNILQFCISYGTLLKLFLQNNIQQYKNILYSIVRLEIILISILRHLQLQSRAVEVISTPKPQVLHEFQKPQRKRSSKNLSGRLSSLRKFPYEEHFIETKRVSHEINIHDCECKKQHSKESSTAKNKIRQFSSRTLEIV